MARLGSFTRRVLNGTGRLLVMMRFSTVGEDSAGLGVTDGVAVVVAVAGGATALEAEPADPHAPSTSRLLTANAALEPHFMIAHSR